MAWLGSRLVVAVVLFLVAASYPTPLVMGSSSSPPAAEKTKTTTGEDAAKDRKAAPASLVDEDVDSREKAVEILSRLKEKPDQVAAKAHEPAVELPRRIKIPAIGVDAGFEFVGLAADGAMDVPKNADNAAWYQLGPRPGERGNAVVAGHVDWGGKLAVFWGLSRLKAGDTVEVVAADDRKYEFSVQWVRLYDAAQAPVQEVFGQADGTELTLITCGGDFDRKNRQYLSRVVARAVLR